MSVVVAVVAVVVTSAVWWVGSTIAQRRQSPPGPFPLPVVGNLLHLARLARQGGGPYGPFRQLAARYGAIFQIKMGQLDVVFLSNYATIKQAFVTQADDFVGRPYENIPMMQVLERETGRGSFWLNGCQWQEVRKLGSVSLGDCGWMQKLEEGILEEVTSVRGSLTALGGSPNYAMPILRRGNLNIITHFLFGYRRQHSDPKLDDFLAEIARSFMVLLNIFGQPINLFPWLRFLPFLIKKREQAFVQNILEVDDYVKNLLDEHEKTFDPKKPRGFVDLLLELKNKDRDLFRDSAVRRVIVDLLKASTDAIAVVLYWGVLYVAAHQDVQKKCLEEIDQHVGRSRQITSSDLVNMKYCQAAMLEVFRAATILPFSLPHCTTRDTELDGYRIPKDTMVMAFTERVHRNPEIFPEPETFNPEHFLDKEGNITNEDYFFTFSAGPRRCMGEKLNKLAVSLVLLNIIQTFAILPASGKTIDLRPSPKLGPNVEGREQDVIFERR